MPDGGCYCGALRYRTEGKPVLKALCHCRECQYISGGGANHFMLVPEEGFAFTKGTARSFSRGDLAAPVTREFCGTCGTHITTRLPGQANLVLKVGTLDDPAIFGRPAIAIHTADQQPFHFVPEDMPAFERLPPRG